LKRSFWKLGAAFLVILLLAVFLLNQRQTSERTGALPVNLKDTSAPTKTFPTKLAEPSMGKPCQQTQTEVLLPTSPSTQSAATIATRALSTPIIRLDPNQLSFRAGFGLAATAQPEYWAEQLHAGWFLDWAVKPRPAEQLPEHWQTVRLKPGCVYPSQEYLRWAALSYPGNVWIIGNEPDVIWQDDVTPEEYAVVYHDLYQAIKSTDPTAQIATGAISQATPLRLEYLDRVLKTYRQQYDQPMPVDWWTVHGYVLREELNSWGVGIPPGFTVTQGELREVDDHGRLDLFEKQLTDFRRWMAENGYRNKPLALTEFGILMPADYGFPVEMVAAYMQESFAWLQETSDENSGDPNDENRLVQRWAWFSLADALYPGPDLANLGAGTLTPLGEAFRDYVVKNRP
jgi:hypothetical protein